MQTTQVEAPSTDKLLEKPAYIDLAELLFLATALVAPLELKIFASFTAYDFLTIGIAFLIAIGPRRMQMLPPRYLPFIYIFLLFALLSTFRAFHPVESFTQILQFAFIFFVQLPVILTMANSRFIIQLSLALFVVGALTAAGWAIFFQQVQGAGRVLVFFSDNPNRLGYPTAYIAPLAIYLFTELWRRKRSILILLLALPVAYLLIWALAASASRSATVGTLVALIVYLVFRQGSKIDWKIPLRFVLTILLLSALGYLLYQAEYFPSTLRDRIERTLAFEDSLIGDRERLNIAGLRAFRESPFIGVGLDNFRFVARDYLASATNQLPHNLWIQFLASIGLVGTLAFSMILIYWFLYMLRARLQATDDATRELLWALTASMTAVLTIYLFLPIMDQRQYWLLYGLGLAVALRVLPATQSEAAKPVRFYIPLREEI